jgi:phage terminase large subunit
LLLLKPDQAAKILDRSRQDPLWFIEHVLGNTPWQKQAEILTALKDHREIAVASCHAAGKSWISARAVLWFLYCHTLSRVVTTAPTFDQVRDILWQEIRQAHASALSPLGGKMLETRLDLGPNWFATGRSTDNANRFQGAHSPKGHILAVIDEAAGIKPDIWVGIDGITTSENAHKLAIGNPTESSGEFFEMFRTPGIHTIHISAFDTPNFTTFDITLEDIRDGSWNEKITGPLPAPYLVDPGWVAKRWARWGEESPLWISRVMGRFPENSTDTLIPLSWIERAQAAQLPPGEPNVLAADIARFGSDDTVIGHRLGPVARIIKVTRQEDTMTSTGRIIQALIDTGATEARIDAVGIGAGVYDRLNEQHQPAIEMQAGQGAQNSERFLNARAEWYWGLRDRLESGDIDLDRDEELTFQLSNIKYKPNSRGQIVIESKDDMKKRGLKSPDKADTIMMLFAAVDGGNDVGWGTSRLKGKRT